MRHWFPILSLLACALPAQGQGVFTLSGRVLDASTSLPLPLVHVFLDGTSRGDVTRDDGSFRLEGIAGGSYDLVASYVGFDRYERHVTVGGALSVEISLTPRTESVGEVVVLGERDRGWLARLDRFLRMFMGSSRYARECVLENPEVLDFVENTVLETLTARASRPLRIRNEALGYEVTYWLDHFVGGKLVIDWSGKGYFMPMRPEDEGQERRWNQRRRDVYRGSVRHFLAAAAEDRLLDEDFRAAEVWQPGSMEPGFLPGDFVEMDSAMGQYRVNFKRAVRVEYKAAAEAAEYGAGSRRSSQISWITLRGMHAFFDGTGRLTSPSSVVKYGYWAWSERMATTLPWDYAPDGP